MILHFDFSTGASGDKLLGALLEVCEQTGAATFASLQACAQALVPGVEVQRTRVSSGGIQATHIEVQEPDAPARHWRDIREMIAGVAAVGALSPAAVKLAELVFSDIAEAEAAVHGCSPEQVHFHEIGAADSIIDIVGSSLLFQALAPEAVYATPLAIGSGTVMCAHGELPVPAPATARLLEGCVVFSGAHTGELTTPTGAALARHLVTNWEPLPGCRPLAVGYGAGSRQIPGAANVVRLLAGQAVSLAGGGDGDGGSNDQYSCIASDTVNGDADLATTDAASRTSPRAGQHLAIEGCVLLESNIDHLSPEALAFACEELLATGALDVWQEPITMKKGRLAVKLCVLAAPAQTERLAEEVAQRTGTLGIRRTYVERSVVPRQQVVLDTPYGPMPYKVARSLNPATAQHGLRPEHEAVARLARECGLDYNALYAELTQLPRSLINQHTREIPRDKELRDN